MDGKIYAIGGSAEPHWSLGFSTVEEYNTRPTNIEDTFGEQNNPTEYLLHQNYPNPFNPVTKIKYQLPELSFVTLKVYDVLGNEIAALVNKEKPAGSYEVEFNATSLPSGVYFYTIRTNEFIETKKMVLMK